MNMTNQSSQNNHNKNVNLENNHQNFPILHVNKPTHNINETTYRDILINQMKENITNKNTEEDYAC